LTKWQNSENPIYKFFVDKNHILHKILSLIDLFLQSKNFQKAGFTKQATLNINQLLTVPYKALKVSWIFEKGKISTLKKEEEMAVREKNTGWVQQSL